MKSGPKHNRFFLAIGAAFSISAASTQAQAGCIDAGIATCASPHTVNLCVTDYCETAMLSRACGNVHYSSQNYENSTEQWLFRVRYHEGGVEDDEYFVIRNEIELSITESQQVTCLNPERESGCDFINDVLSNSPFE